MQLKHQEGTRENCREGASLLCQARHVCRLAELLLDGDGDLLQILGQGFSFSSEVNV